MSVFESYISQVEDQLMGFVDSGSDDDLFHSSYLHGHVDVVIAEYLIANKFNLDSLSQSVKQSLQRAFDDKELEPSDQHAVLQMWLNIHQSVLAIVMPDRASLV